MSRIIIFWDSISWWACDYEKQWRANRLREYYDNYEDMSVYNCWISWENTNDLLQRFEIESNPRLSKKTDNIVIFAIWINDSLYINKKWNNRTNIDKFKSNITELINKAISKYNRVVFLWLTNVDESKTMPIPWSPTKYYNNEDVIQYNKVIQKICNQFNIQFIDIYNLININELDDWLHPDSKWHEKIYNKIKDELNLFS